MTTVRRWFDPQHYYRARQLLGMIAHAIKARDKYEDDREFWDKRIDRWVDLYDDFIRETKEDDD